MTPLELHTTLTDALETVLPGVPVLFGYPTANAEQVEPWLLLETRHRADVDANDPFGEDDVYQQVTVRVGAFSPVENPERAMAMAESVREKLAGLFVDDLSLGAGRFDSIEAESQWYGLAVSFNQARYTQG